MMQKNVLGSHLLWAEVDLDAIGSNIKKIKRMVGPDVMVMTVVKADAYGHGAVPVAKKAISCGADFLGVARVEEGIEIRKAGISTPVLVFGYTPEDMIEKVIRHHLTPSVYSLDYAKRLSQFASSLNTKIPVHLKIDTGMGRLGILQEASCLSALSKGSEDSVEEVVKKIDGLPHLKITGIYTHFATADEEDTSYVKKQFSLFSSTIQRLKSQGICTGICHAANSAATLTQPRTHMDMVRTGLITYGLYPFKETAGRKLNLTPALSLKTRIVHLKQIPKGFRLGYGATWQAERKSIIATVAVGYADGLNRSLSSKGEMLVNGLRAPIVGRICMDMTMLDVTEVPDPRVGDEVVIIGRQDHATIHTDWIAEMTGTVNYEIVSTIGRRVDRIYPNIKKRAALKTHAITVHDRTHVSQMLRAVG